MELLVSINARESPPAAPELPPPRHTSRHRRPLELLGCHVPVPVLPEVPTRLHGIEIHRCLMTLVHCGLQRVDVFVAGGLTASLWTLLVEEKEIKWRGVRGFLPGGSRRWPARRAGSEWARSTLRRDSWLHRPLVWKR